MKTKSVIAFAASFMLTMAFFNPVLTASPLEPVETTIARPVSSTSFHASQDPKVSPTQQEARQSEVPFDENVQINEQLQQPALGSVREANDTVSGKAHESSILENETRAIVEGSSNNKTDSEGTPFTELSSDNSASNAPKEQVSSNVPSEQEAQNENQKIEDNNKSDSVQMLSRLEPVAVPIKTAKPIGKAKSSPTKKIGSKMNLDVKGVGDKGPNRYFKLTQSKNSSTTEQNNGVSLPKGVQNVVDKAGEILDDIDDSTLDTVNKPLSALGLEADSAELRPAGGGLGLKVSIKLDKGKDDGKKLSEKEQKLEKRKKVYSTLSSSNDN